jgi:NADPH-dependent curcumin reductase CurA
LPGFERAGEHSDLDLLPFGSILTTDGGDHAGIEVFFEDIGTDLVQSCLDCLNLPDDIYAVGVFFQHALNSAQMPFRDAQALERVSLQRFSSQSAVAATARS